MLFSKQKMDDGFDYVTPIPVGNSAYRWKATVAKVAKWIDSWLFK